MDTLGKWSLEDKNLKIWLIPELEQLALFPKKVVPKCANDWLKILNK